LEILEFVRKSGFNKEIIFHTLYLILKSISDHHNPNQKEIEFIKPILIDDLITNFLIKSKYPETDLSIFVLYLYFSNFQFKVSPIAREHLLIILLHSQKYL
jgi:hypothetical protein